MYNNIVNGIGSFIEQGMPLKAMDYAVLAVLILIALSLAIILWTLLNHLLFWLDKNRQLKEWRKGKPRMPKAGPQGQPAR